MTQHSHYIPTSFRCLSDEQFGTLQHLHVDAGWSIPRLVRKFRVSSSTVYKARRAIPAHLIRVLEAKPKARVHRLHSRSRRKQA